jgi:hypothetical protein
MKILVLFQLMSPLLFTFRRRIPSGSLEVIQQTASLILAALEPPVSEDVTSEELEAVAA